MISNLENHDHAFVWIFLPGESEPVVAGRITQEKSLYLFTYGRRYLENPKAMALSPLELPLETGNFFPSGMKTIPACLRDASPDAWGRRVIHYQYPTFNPNEIDYFLLSRSDRIGALDFQTSPSHYVERTVTKATVEDLLEAASFVANNQPLPHELEYALLRGTSVGGARPKALIEQNNKTYIAKFSLNTDVFNIVKFEYVGMRLAQKVGLNVSNVKKHQVLGKDVLLVERFDREKRLVNKKTQITRHFMLSALSLLKLDELEARYASYCDMADIIRQHFAFPKEDLLELYKRLIFNILIGNTDDHARNHAAFWDGRILRLTPAYDLCPQWRVGQEATQAMLMEGIEGNLSTLLNAQSISEHFQISAEEAREIINHMIEIIEHNWADVCHEASLSKKEIQSLWKNIIFNPFCFRGW